MNLFEQLTAQGATIPTSVPCPHCLAEKHPIEILISDDGERCSMCREDDAREAQSLVEAVQLGSAEGQAAALAELERDLLNQVNGQAAVLTSKLITRGAELDYADQRAEVEDADTLEDGIASLSATDQESRFPFISALAVELGIGPEAVALSIKNAMASQKAARAAINAKRVAVQGAIRAGETAEAKRAAAVVSWPEG